MATASFKRENSNPGGKTVPWSGLTLNQAHSCRRHSMRGAFAGSARLLILLSLLNSTCKMAQNMQTTASDSEPSVPNRFRAG